MFIASNDRSDIERYAMLCEKTPTGWIDGQCGSGRVEQETVLAAADGIGTQAQAGVPA